MLHTPVALIGLACRFPGAPDADAFWHLLQGDTPAIRPVPPARWVPAAAQARHPGHAVQPALSHAAWLDDTDLFDAAFFGLSDAEARRMDPQQRLALEGAWLALESAGLVPRQLAGSDTAVVFGVGHADHAMRLRADHASYDGRLGPHGYECFVANRISYALNLRGPSLTVNAACASSGVALHQAAQMLRAGECALALAGGVNLNLLPDETVSSALAGWLADDGRCRSFHRDGRGFVRGEGCGVLVLKRLDDARRDGDPVLGVLWGSAVGHNGLSNGIASPSGAAQREVLSRALRAAGVAATAIGHLEAHGTGGPVSDAIEAGAFTAVLAEGRDASTPLRVGASKPLIGHAEAASGVAGVIKTLLALQHGRLPAIAGLDTPNAALPAHPAVHLLQTPAAWPALAGRPRLGMVSNFSFGGTNVALVVGDPPEAVDASAAAVPPATGWRGPVLLRLSARSPQALAAQRALAGAAALSADARHTLNTARSLFGHRLAATADSPEALAAHLRGTAGPDTAGGVHSRDTLPAGAAGAPRVLWLGARGLPGAEAPDLAAALDDWTATATLRAAWRAAGGPDPARADAGRWLAAFWAFALHRLGLGLAGALAAPGLGPAAALARGALSPAALADWLGGGAAPTLPDTPDHGEAATAADLAARWPAGGGRPPLLLALGPLPAGAGADGALPAVTLAAGTPAGGRPSGTAGDWRLALLDLLATAWVAGADLRLEALGPGRRVAVPSAPFHRTPCGFVASDATPADPPAQRVAAAARTTREAA